MVDFTIPVASFVQADCLAIASSLNVTVDMLCAFIFTQEVVHTHGHPQGPCPFPCRQGGSHLEA